MNCITGCIKAKCLATPVYCDEEYSTAQNLIIGAMPDADTAYTLYVLDQNSEVTKPINITSDSQGMLTFNMNDYPGFFHPNTSYKAWVTIAGEGLNDTQDITFDQYNVYPCVLLEFNTVSESSESLIGIENQEVTV